MMSRLEERRWKIKMEKDNLLEFVRESANNTGIFYLNGDIPVWTEDELPSSVDLSAVLSKVERVIPSAFFRYIHAVRVGMFDEMVERQINALYKDGVLYVSNIQDNNQDMIDDIVHEISHAVEENNSVLIYGDGKIEQEFLGKRKRLFSLLTNNGFDATMDIFLNPKYDYNFDMFLFQTVGYPLLNSLTTGLFPSAYSVTSVNEYFAIGFEQYYLENARYLDKVSPQLLRKLNYLEEIANEY